MTDHPADRQIYYPPPLVVEVRSCRMGWQFRIDERWCAAGRRWGLTHSAGWRPTRTWAIRAGQATLTRWLKFQERHARPWQEVLTDE